MGGRWSGLLVALLVGCGPGVEVPTGLESSVGALRLTVRLEAGGLSPAWAQMLEGGTLVFLNADAQPRRVLFGVLEGEEHCGAWSGPPLEPGREYPLTAARGLHLCTFHMEGQAPEDARFQGVVEVLPRRGRVVRNR